MLKICILDVSLVITNLRLQAHLSWANELNQWPRIILFWVYPKKYDDCFFCVCVFCNDLQPFDFTNNLQHTGASVATLMNMYKVIHSELMI